MREGFRLGVSLHACGLVGSQSRGCLRDGMQVSPTLRILCSSEQHSFLLGSRQSHGVWIRDPQSEGSRERPLGMED